MMMRIAVLFGLAAGVCSAVFFLSLMIGAGAYLPLLVSAAIVAGLVWWVRIPTPAAPGEPVNRWVVVFFAAALIAAIAASIMLGFKQPHGDWDAWAIWNLHARFLVRGGAKWTLLFSKRLAWSYPDYPLLLPALIAQIWSVIHSESTVVPFVIAFLFTFVTVAFVVAAVRRYRGWNEALIAGALLLGCTDHLVIGSAQYADVPLAFYIAAALVLLCIEDATCTILAGAMAGIAAWTKNEGLWFILVLVASRCFARWRAGRLAGVEKELGGLGIGAAPMLVVLAIFKFRYAPANQLLFGHSGGEIVSHAFDFGRYVTVIEAYVRSIYHAGELLLPAVIVLAVYAWLVRFRVEPEQRVAVTTVVSAVALMLLGYFVVYVLFPNDLAGLLNTSATRVFTQIWPAALIGFFWAASRVELVAVSSPEKPTKKTAATRRR